MKKALKWIFGILIVLILIVAVSGFYLIKKADNLMARKMSVDPPSFPIPDDSASIARGEKFAIMCQDCHGKQYEGFKFFDDPEIGTINTPNLTLGKGSAVAAYSDIDWIRAVRHGIRPNGEMLMIMPSKEYYAMGKDDIASLIAFMKHVPKVDNEVVGKDMHNFGKILMSLGAFGEMYSADVLDHTKGPGDAPMEGANAAYGTYLVEISGCKSCHGNDLNGGKHPDPNAPPVPAITSGGNLGTWDDVKFNECIRTGVTPEGKTLQAKYMPYTAYAGLKDDDLKAIYLYLKSLPGKVAQ